MDSLVFTTMASAILIVFTSLGDRLRSSVVANRDSCKRHLKFTTGLEGHALHGHIIKNVTLPMDTQDPCRVQCVMESRCVSINSGPLINNHVVCELSDSDHTKYPQDLKPRDGFIYSGTENPCLNNPCSNNGTCLKKFTEKGHICLCKNGFEGEICQTDSFSSPCEEFYNQNLSGSNTTYHTRPAYCYMFDDLGECGGGGWTLVIKMDGNKSTFEYNSLLWSNNDTFNLPAGETGFDTQETKLPTYWNTSFSKICLGMKIGQHINFIVINKQANSLYSLIADGQYRAASLGRSKWKNLIGSEASLQLYCNQEGFNVYSSSAHSRARIGLLGNEQNHCSSCDSRIGFGSGGSPDVSITCGNVARFLSDNGNKNIKAMGYILVQ